MIWNDGWEQNLNLLQNDPQNLDSLIPKYYRPNNINRFGVDYIFSECNQFAYSFFKLIRSYLYHNFINTVSFSKLMEFGCGPAHNIVYFANKDKSKQYVGLDWAHSSQKLSTAFEKIIPTILRVLILIFLILTKI